MIDNNVWNTINASEEDIIKCASQSDVSDYDMCTMCLNRNACEGIAMKKLLQKLKEINNA